MMADVAAWRTVAATSSAPLALPSSDGMFGVTLDDWAAGTAAGVVLTPSGFVRHRDWPR